MIERRFNKTIEVFKLGAVVANKRTYPVTATFSTIGYDVPAQPEDIALLDGDFNEAVKVFCPVVDIDIGDKIEIDDVEYLVGGKQKYDKQNEKHLELVAYKPNS